MAKQKNQSMFELPKKNMGTISSAFLAVGFTILAGVTLAGISAVKVNAEINQQDYKTTQQIYQDGAAYGTDMSISSYQNYFSEFTRLKHNDDEPIYVYISEQFNQREVELIKEMYANIELYFQTINPNYKFEFVNEFTLANKAINGKTVITYGRMKMENGAGFCLKTPSLLNPNFTAKEVIMIDTSITIPEEKPDYAKMTEKEIEDYESAFADFRASIYEEGFYHGLGFANDVYYKNKERKFYEFGMNATTENLYQNTFILNDSKRYMVDLFPEDYKMLQAMYNQTQTQEQVLQMIDTYENIFYASRKDAIDYLLGTYKTQSGAKVSLQTISQQESQNMLIETSQQYNMYNKDNQYENLGLLVYDFKITLKDGTITFEVYNQDTKELLETSSAKYKNIDGVIFVENLVFEKVKVTFNSGMTYNVDGKVINSFAIAKTIWPQQEKPRYMLYNFSTINRNAGHDEQRDANLFAEYKTELAEKYQYLQNQTDPQPVSIEEQPAVKITNKKTLGLENMVTENFGKFAIAMESKFDSLQIIKDNEKEQ